MKEFESQQFRDELAKTIKQAPKEERRDILDRARKEAKSRESVPQAVDSNDIIEANLETQVKGFLEFRKNSAPSINSQVCEVFATTGITDEQIESYFHTDPETTKVIRFVLESFSKPQDPSKARRKDGSHIAVHSLQLFLSARDYFKITDSDVFRTVLVHDIVEDTQVSGQGIKDHLGEREAQLASQMTEEHLPEELTQGLEKADKNRLSIVKFCEKLKSGGDTIATTEIVDRVDDISDLTYLTQKLEKKPEEKEKVRQALISKFGKCVYTIDVVTRDSENEKVKELKAFFQTLIEQRLLEMKDKFGLEITQSEISDEVEKYKRLQSKEE